MTHKKKRKLIEKLIVVCVLAAVTFSAWMCAEITVEDTEAKNGKDLQHEQEVIFDPFVDARRKMHFAEPNRTSYTAAEELDEIYKDCPALGRLAKDLWGVGEGKLLWKEGLQKIIPTWPNFIELEKDLVIEMPELKDKDFYYHTPRITYFHKGTKIYFMEENE